MSFPSTFVMQRLQVLERALAALAVKSNAWLQSGTSDVACLSCITASLEAHGQIRAMAAAITDLAPHVLAGDQLGAAASMPELTLRAVRLVVLDELTTLREVVSVADGRDRALFRRPLSSFGALECLVHTELHRVMLLCTAFRGTRRDAYRAALRRARSLMRRLGQQSEVGQFLRDGRSRGDWPALQDVCSRLQAALAIRIDVDPDVPLWPWYRSNAAWGSWPESQRHE